MYQFIDKLVADNPLLSRFLNDPTHPFSDQEIQTLIGINYKNYLRDTDWHSTVSLVQFLSAINHPDRLTYLSTRLSKQVMLHMIAADNYFAFRLAASSGHVPALQCLAKSAPDLRQDMIKESFESFDRAANKNDFPVVNFFSFTQTKTPRKYCMNDLVKSKKTRFLRSI